MACFLVSQVVKAGLVLTLFGGCQKYMDDKNRIPIRGDPHLLMVGDPGLGKSQMLQVWIHLFIHALSIVLFQNNYIYSSLGILFFLA